MEPGQGIPIRNIAMEAYCSIILKNVTVQQAGKLLLNRISFTLKADEHLAVFGASGSGKSLLAGVLKGILSYTGSVEFKKGTQSVQPVVAYVPAMYPLRNQIHNTGRYYQQRFASSANETATVSETLLKKGDAVTVFQWLETFRLTHRSHTPLARLSGGELKKVQLVGHLLTHPDVLILDRVFTGLDAGSRKILHAVLNQLASSGTRIILITDSHELPVCITHFAELSEGALVNYAPVEQLGFMQSIPARREAPLPELKKAYHIGPLISMKQVSIRHGNTTILNNINWQVNNGECWLIKGCNGAGKSALLSLINGDHPQAYAQQIHLFGKRRGSGESIWDIKRRIGFVAPDLQHFFDPGITPAQVVGSGFFDAFGLCRKLDEAQARKVTAWLRFFSLQDKAQLPFRSLSDGEQRLVLMARALIKDPLMLALDEPCQGLDDSQSRMVIRLLERIHSETGMTLLFISHYEDEIPACVRHVIELEQGIPTLYKKTMPSTIAKSKNQPLTLGLS
ncbi:ATP-binding cassette domain-containing protein [Niabella sp. CC-SYL272]|uniref:ATP-binding cassette domain-containing protein n=1 Tax=Niabella agricola TaxID=2891571 RepID=UPI001F28C20A|nr:ATP-binding cassette domain-containing protein [Niabella agricola]MCF3111612.1 ATP-binding cassette domain-containing protein [Niabella agricola]